ncbi:MAG: ATP-binding protein [Jannaschia sp.]
MTARPARLVDDALMRDRFVGTADAVRGYLQVLQETARHRELDRELREDVMIVLGEVLNNIVEHAFRAGDGWIDCTVRQIDGRLSVETCDNGLPMPPTLMVHGSLPEIGEAPDDLPEGGFGWFIIHSLVDDMVYERENGRNRLSFSFDMA